MNISLNSRNSIGNNLANPTIWRNCRGWRQRVPLRLRKRNSRDLRSGQNWNVKKNWVTTRKELSRNCYQSSKRRTMSNTLSTNWIVSFCKQHRSRHRIPLRKSRARDFVNLRKSKLVPNSKRILHPFDKNSPKRMLFLADALSTARSKVNTRHNIWVERIEIWRSKMWLSSFATYDNHIQVNSQRLIPSTSTSTTMSLSPQYTPLTRKNISKRLNFLEHLVLGANSGMISSKSLERHHRFVYFAATDYGPLLSKAVMICDRNCSQWILYKNSRKSSRNRASHSTSDHMKSLLHQRILDLLVSFYEIATPLTVVTFTIEFLPNTLSLDALKKTVPNFNNLHDFYVRTFDDYFEEAQKNFVESLAGYSLVSYLL